MDSGAGATVRALRVHLSGVVFSLVAFFLAGTGLTTALTAAATSAAVLLLCHALAGAAVGAAVPQVARARVRTAIRDRELRTAFLPQCDPDADGRPRPRAPGRRLATAV
ncbi:hypothetical protein G4Z16_22235 [Streptomyces bathyalis]|uniref:Uncharacterized protein n=1 Tax=Streptomyces bathyalis TaxID=2710756 RepID=A0A7T1TDC3_9ACTN|nr:hypothetical protein G4Z16_22235 [Streptomyces bathyalis]